MFYNTQPRGVVFLQYLFTNWTYLFINLFIACDVGIMSGFSVFGPKIVEVGFNLTPGQASALLGNNPPCPILIAKPVLYV